MMPREKQIGRSGAIALGGVVALTGIAIVAVALFAKGEGFHSPRWVVACAGAAFLFFGGWTSALYALGYDPKRPKETLPPPGIQLLVVLPGLLFFAAPFHWVAFGPGPRVFSSTFSLFSFSSRGRASEMTGRWMFGIGCLLIDAIVVAASCAWRAICPAAERLSRKVVRSLLRLPPTDPRILRSFPSPAFGERVPLQPLLARPPIYALEAPRPFRGPSASRSG